MATDKNEAEKKFDDLLNDKCSWTYKSIKTIKCEANGKNNLNGPVLKIRTVNIEENAYNCDSSKKDTISLFDEYDKIEDTKKCRNSEIIRRNSTKMTKQKEIFSKNTQKTKRNKRTVKAINYAESNCETDQSSSDDGLVFLSRTYDEKILNGTQFYSNSNLNEKNYLNMENTGDKNFKISEENFIEETDSSDQIFKSNKDEKESEKEIFQDQNGEHALVFNDLTRNSFMSSQKETAITLSKEICSPSELHSSELGINEKQKPSNDDLVSEIIKQYGRISTEVQSVCDELETQNEDEIFNDFFSGNFSVDKYKLKIDTPTNASTTERNENESEFLNKMSDYSLRTFDSTIHAKEVRKRKKRNSNGTKEKFAKSEIKNTKELLPSYLDSNGSLTDQRNEKSSRSYALDGKNFSDVALDEDENSLTDFQKHKIKKSDCTKNKLLKSGIKKTRIKEQQTLRLDSNENPSEFKIKDVTKNNSIEEFFSENVLNGDENKMLNENKQNQDCSVESKNVENTNTYRILDAKTENLCKQYEETQLSVNSKGNMSLGNNDSRATKIHKTWEDLEADILNRNENISFPYLETEVEDLHQSRLGFSKPQDDSDTQNKWNIVKSEPGNSTQLAHKKNVSFDSPNSNIIDRVIRKMQLCASPVLAPSKVVSQLEKHKESPILTEYSYSVQETKSVILTTKKISEKQTWQPKITYKRQAAKNRMKKNNNFYNHDMETTDSHEASIINPTTIKLNETSGEMKMKLSKSPESDHDNMIGSSDISEMKSLISESDNYTLLPRDSCSNAGGLYNLRKRKLTGDNKQTKNKQNVAKVIDAVKNNSVTKYMKSTDRQGKKHISLSKHHQMEDYSNENSVLTTKKKYKSNKSKNVSTDTSESDLPENKALSIYYKEKNNAILKTNNKEVFAQDNTILKSGKQTSPFQNLQKATPKSDSKQEYEQYLKKLFNKDVDYSNVQWDLSDNINEKPKKLTRKNMIYSNMKNVSSESSDELFSLSSDTEFEDTEQSPPKRASGLLDEVFN